MFIRCRRRRCASCSPTTSTCCKDTNLVAVYADDVFVTVVVEEKNGVVGTSRLMIMFSAKDMQLKQWTVTDPQGYDTTVAVYNLDTTKKPDPSLFRIDYTRYHGFQFFAELGHGIRRRHIRPCAEHLLFIADHDIKTWMAGTHASMTLENCRRGS